MPYNGASFSSVNFLKYYLILQVIWPPASLILRPYLFLRQRPVIDVQILHGSGKCRISCIIPCICGCLMVEVNLFQICRVREYFNSFR